MKNSIIRLSGVRRVTKLGSAAFMLAGGWFALATSAPATVFTGTRTIGPTTVNLSITTDGTVGSLAPGNLTDWMVQVTNPTNPSNDNFTFTPFSSDIYTLGTGLVATATALTFDFSSTSYNAFEFMAKAPDTNGFTHFYCVGSLSSCSATGAPPGSPGEEVVFAQNPGNRGTYYGAYPPGVITLATAPDDPGAVPEPASWALMVVGFGALGAAMRRRPSARRLASIR